MQLPEWLTHLKACGFLFSYVALTYTGFEINWDWDGGVYMHSVIFEIVSIFLLNTVKHELILLWYKLLDSIQKLTQVYESFFTDFRGFLDHVCSCSVSLPSHPEC